MTAVFAESGSPTVKNPPLAAVLPDDGGGASGAQTPACRKYACPNDASSTTDFSGSTPQRDGVNAPNLHRFGNLGEPDYFVFGLWSVSNFHGIFPNRQNRIYLTEDDVFIHSAAAAVTENLPSSGTATYNGQGFLYTGSPYSSSGLPGTQRVGGNTTFTARFSADDTTMEGGFNSSSAVNRGGSSSGVVNITFLPASFRDGGFRGALACSISGGGRCGLGYSPHDYWQGKFYGAGDSAGDAPKKFGGTFYIPQSEVGQVTNTRVHGVFGAVLEE